MQLKSILISALTVAASGAFAEQCGIAEPTEQQLNMSMNFFNNEDITRGPGLAPRTTVPPIKVHIHVVAAGEEETEGYISVSSELVHFLDWRTNIPPEGNGQSTS